MESTLQIQKGQCEQHLTQIIRVEQCATGESFSQINTFFHTSSCARVNIKLAVSSLVKIINHLLSLHCIFISPSIAARLQVEKKHQTMNYRSVTIHEALTNSIAMNCTTCLLSNNSNTILSVSKCNLVFTSQM